MIILKNNNFSNERLYQKIEFVFFTLFGTILGIKERFFQNYIFDPKINLSLRKKYKIQISKNKL